MVAAKPAMTTSEIMEDLYGGQRWCANDRTVRDGYRAVKPSRKFIPLSVIEYFNCDKVDHAAKDCHILYKDPNKTAGERSNGQAQR